MWHKLRRYLRESYSMGHFPSFTEAMRFKGPKLAYFGFLGDEMVYWATKKRFPGLRLVPIKLRSSIELKVLSRWLGINRNIVK